MSRDTDPPILRDWRDALAPGLAAMGLVVPAATQARLLEFVELLHKWNQAYNLTATSTLHESVVYHVLDSLSIGRFLHGYTVLDVGTGAGLPGIPLALARPELRFTLLDSNGKKVRFVKQALMTLQLANLDVVRGRVEGYHPEARFDTVLCRAFSKLEEFVRFAGDLCAPTGQLLAMKGVYPDEELQKVPASFRVRGVHPVSVPGLRAERHLVELALHRTGE